MKPSPTFLPVLAVFLLLASACQRLPESTTDPLPFPIEANKDLDTAPGDDFFRYCTGAGLDKLPFDGKSIVGHMYSSEDELGKMLDKVFETDPVLSRFEKDMESAQTKAAASNASLQKLLDRIPDPATASMEEYFRFMGTLYREGIHGLAQPLLYADHPVYKLAASLSIRFWEEPDYDKPLTEAQQKNAERAFKALAEGMGVDPAFTRLGEDRSKYMLAAAMECEPARAAAAIREAITKHLGIFTDGTTSFEALWKEISSSVIYQKNYAFVQAYTDEQLRQSALDHMEELRVQFRKRIGALDWMGGTTKVKALEKLDAMRFQAVRPDAWVEAAITKEEELAAAGSPLEEYLIMRKHFHALPLALAGTRIQDQYVNEVLASGNSIYHLNAFYMPVSNGVFIFPGLLIPPFMRQDISEAYAYAVFAVLGHEMTHGFDSYGSSFDKEGRAHNWWTVADKMAFEERCKLLVECHNHLEVSPEGLPGTYNDGQRTLGENIADLGGFLIVLDAYTEHLLQQGYFGEVLRAQQRKYFEAYADTWSCKYTDAYIKKTLSATFPDVHAFARERVNGVVMNTDRWYELYDVTRLDALYLPPERRARIW